MYGKSRAVRTAAIVAAALFVAVFVPAGASAQLDPGALPAETLVVSNHHCKLTRIGNQLVRCDSLTGAGVLAPSWIPED